MDNKTVRILIAEHDLALGQRLKCMLEKIGIINMIDVVENGESALKLAKKNRLQIAFIDYNLTDIHAIELAQKIHKKHSDCHFVFLFEVDCLHCCKIMRKLRASCLLRKNVTLNRLKRLVEGMMDGDVISSGKDCLSKKSMHQYEELLTDRQHLILSLSAKGRKNPEIAKEIYTSTRTVEEEFSKINEMFGVKSKIMAVIKYVRTYG